MKISELFAKVAATANKAEKIQLLKDNRTGTLDAIFNAAYNPDLMYGVTSNQITGRTIAVLNTLDIGEYWGVAVGTLNDLNSRKVTGNNAAHAVLRLLEFLDRPSQEIILNILDKNLKIGISLESYQKDVMHIKPTKFEVTLAQHLEDVKGVNPLDGTWWASRKCDGVRCVAFYDSKDKSVEFYSRQGKKFTTLDNLIPAVQDFCDNLIGRWVLDGELCKIDENGDEHFDQIVGECKKKNHTIQDCCYQLFDVVHRSIFDGDVIGDRNFESRYNQLIAMDTLKGKEFEASNKGCCVKVLEQENILNHDDFARWSKKVATGNWEGFMLRKNVPFEKGRTKNLLKVKEFHDAEFIVKDLTTAELTSAEPGKGNVKYMGVDSLTIEYKGNIVKVGSGLTKEQRKEWCADPSKIIGKTICVKYFQESQDKDGKFSLRFPTLKYVYEDNREV